jgi:hypothetical protein
MMSSPNGVAEWVESCRLTFTGCPEADRIERYASIVDCEPDTPVPLYRLAKACLDSGHWPLWHQGIMLAFIREHRTAQSLCERALAKLRLGDWSGWRDYEAHTKSPAFGVAHATWLRWKYPAWDGIQDIRDQTLLVHRMGGYGDVIWSLRFIPSIAARVGRLIWDTSPALIDFVRHNLGHLTRVESIVHDPPDIEFDWHIWSLSLPHVNGGVLPFVLLVAPAPARWPRPSECRLRVGICWACSDEAVDHLERSIPLSFLAPFFWRREIEWYSLQIGSRAHDADSYPGVRQPPVPLRTFADTANVVVGLDCVIAVDSAICHLAGSLGVPTLTLLRCTADAKWGHLDTTPLYPSMRLIRQRIPGDWLGVVQVIHRELNGRLG